MQGRENGEQSKQAVPFRQNAWLMARLVQPGRQGSKIQARVSTQNLLELYVFFFFSKVKIIMSLSSLGCLLEVFHLVQFYLFIYLFIIHT